MTTALPVQFKLPSSSNSCPRCVLTRKRLQDATQILVDRRKQAIDLRAERDTVIQQLGRFAQAMRLKILQFKRDSEQVRKEVVDLGESNSKLLVMLQTSLYAIESALLHRKAEAAQSVSSICDTKPEKMEINETIDDGLELARSFWSSTNTNPPAQGIFVPDLSKVVAKLTRQNISLEKELELVRNQQSELRAQLKSQRKLSAEQDQQIDDLREKLEQTEQIRADYADVKLRYNAKRSAVSLLQKECEDLREKYKKITKEAVDKEVQLQGVRGEHKNKDRLIFMLRASLADKERELQRYKAATSSSGTYPSPCGSTPGGGYSSTASLVSSSAATSSDTPISSSSGDKLIPDNEREQETLIKAAFESAIELLKMPSDVKDRKYLAAVEDAKRMRADCQLLRQQVQAAEKQAAEATSKLYTAEQHLEQLNHELALARNKHKEMETIIAGFSDKLLQSSKHAEEQQKWCASYKQENEMLRVEVKQREEQTFRMRELLESAAARLEHDEKAKLNQNLEMNKLLIRLQEATQALQEKGKSLEFIRTEVQFLQHQLATEKELSQRLNAELQSKEKVIDNTLRLTQMLDNAISSNHHQMPSNMSRINLNGRLPM